MKTSSYHGDRGVASPSVNGSQLPRSEMSHAFKGKSSNRRTQVWKVLVLEISKTAPAEGHTAEST
jgi:hypothetical protein